MAQLIASDTKDPWFESSHPQFVLTINSIEKIKIKKKEKRGQEMAH